MFGFNTEKSGNTAQKASGSNSGGVSGMYARFKPGASNAVAPAGGGVDRSAEAARSMQGGLGGMYGRLSANVANKNLPTTSEGTAPPMWGRSKLNQPAVSRTAGRGQEGPRGIAQGTYAREGSGPGMPPLNRSRDTSAQPAPPPPGYGTPGFGESGTMTGPPVAQPEPTAPPPGYGTPGFGDSGTLTGPPPLPEVPTAPPPGYGTPGGGFAPTGFPQAPPSPADMAAMNFRGRQMQSMFGGPRRPRSAAEVAAIQSRMYR